MDHYLDTLPAGALVEYYGDDLRQQYTYSLASGTGRVPVVYVQGGGWQDPLPMPRDPALHLAREWFQQQPGIAYFEMYYRGGHVDAVRHDVALGLRHIAAQADAYGIQLDRLVVAGFSAGGDVAFSLALDRGYRAPQIWAVAGFSPAGLSFDGAEAPERTALLLQQAGFISTAQTAQAHLHTWPDPLRHALIVHARDDSQVPWQWSAAFVEAAAERGRRVEFVLQPDGEHGGPANPATNPDTAARLSAWWR